MSTVEELWRNLLEKDDRTSPEDYPDMALIKFEEFAGYIGLATASPQSGPSRRLDEPNTELGATRGEDDAVLVERVSRAIAKAKRDPGLRDSATIERVWRSYCGMARAAIKELQS